jgi:hypothetical protein
MITVAIRALGLEYLVKILDWDRRQSQYIFTDPDSDSTLKFLPTPTQPKIPTDSDSTTLTPPKNSVRLQLHLKVPCDSYSDST